MTFPDDGGVNWIAINIGFREEVGWLPVGSEAAWRRVARRTRRRTVARRRRRRRRWDWNNFVSTKLTQTRSHSDGQAGTTVQHLNCCRHCQEPFPQKVPSTCMAFILHIIDLEANLFIFPDSYFSSNLPSSSSLVSLVTTWYTRLIMSWERALVLLDWKTPRNCFVDFIVHCRFFFKYEVLFLTVWKYQHFNFDHPSQPCNWLRLHPRLLQVLHRMVGHTSPPQVCTSISNENTI